ncbi:hypothetical protein BD410DRAFT_842210 [Rickenella mellea]|uniref:Uncharacterized protein n=1 Tax=Rickenella mellea TaxID=50990 RepID=A0A4Y7PWM1_9AGAM|nr:hypothetical protein BD410DRAFT_842210 [Rickenella mellea]
MSIERLRGEKARSPLSPISPMEVLRGGWRRQRANTAKHTSTSLHLLIKFSALELTITITRSLQCAYFKFRPLRTIREPDDVGCAADPGQTAVQDVWVAHEDFRLEERGRWEGFWWGWTPELPWHKTEFYVNDREEEVDYAVSFAWVIAWRRHVIKGVLVQHRKTSNGIFANSASHAHSALRDRRKCVYAETVSSTDTEASGNAPSQANASLLTPPLSSLNPHLPPGSMSNNNIGLKASIYTHQDQDSPTSSLEDLISTPYPSLWGKEILDLTEVPGEEVAPETDRGEKQREQWTSRSAREVDALTSPKPPRSAMLGRNAAFGMPRRVEIGPGLPPPSKSSSFRLIPAKALRLRRPHTAEGSVRRERNGAARTNLSNPRELRPIRVRTRPVSNLPENETLPTGEQVAVFSVIETAPTPLGTAQHGSIRLIRHFVHLHHRPRLSLRMDPCPVSL